MISIACPRCQMRMEVSAEHAGQRRTCAGCGQLVHVPGPAKVSKLQTRGGRDWFYMKDGVKQGPLSSKALRNAAREGWLSPDDLVWVEGMPEWTRASRVKGVFSDEKIVNETPERGSNEPVTQTSLPIKSDPNPQPQSLSAPSQEPERGNEPVAQTSLPIKSDPNTPPLSLPAQSQEPGTPPKAAAPSSPNWAPGSFALAVIVALVSFLGNGNSKKQTPPQPKATPTEAAFRIDGQKRRENEPASPVRPDPQPDPRDADWARQQQVQAQILEAMRQQQLQQHLRQQDSEFERFQKTMEQVRVCQACGGAGTYRFVDSFGRLQLQQCPYCRGLGRKW